MLVGWHRVSNFPVLPVCCLVGAAADKVRGGLTCVCQASKLRVCAQSRPKLWTIGKNAVRHTTCSNPELLHSPLRSALADIDSLFSAHSFAMANRLCWVLKK